MFTSKDRRLVIACLAFFACGSIWLFSPASWRTKTFFSLFRASYRLAPSTFQAHLPYLDVLSVTAAPFAPVWMDVQSGVRMRLDPNDLVSRVILETGSWEPESTAALLSKLGPGSTFIDVGAHIGYYSLMAAAAVGPQGRVIAVEPNPETLSYLNENVRESKATSIKVWPVACAEEESTLQLYLAPSGNTGETSLSKANASQEGQSTVSYPVRARPLDAIATETNIGRVDVIKIDVEGAELKVLKGAVRTLAQYRPLLIIEMVPHQLEAMGTSVEEVKRFLSVSGYVESRHIDDLNIEFTPRHNASSVDIRRTAPFN